MIQYMTANKPAGVRAECSEQAVWRDALGGRERLLVFAVWGEALDAPEHIPAGSVRATKFGAFQQACYREVA